MEATRPGVLVIFDPVSGVVAFDSQRLKLQQIVTRRVLPQSGTLLVHGRRADGSSVVALYDLVNDPKEQKNLTADPAQSEVREKLKALLKQGLPMERLGEGGTESD